MINWKTKKFEVSINNNMINKNELGNKSNYVNGFEKKTLNIVELSNNINSGYAYCPVLNGKRCSANFISSQIISLDIDKDHTLEKFKDHPFIIAHATLIHTTASHTDRAHRFRAIFLLEVPIFNAEDYEAITRLLIDKLDTDPVTADSARMFFGNNKNNKIEIFNKGIDSAMYQKLLNEANSIKKMTKLVQVPTISKDLNFKDIKVITAKGNKASLSQLDEKTSIYCPKHDDKNPSAVVIASKKTSNKGVYCSTCNKTYWFEKPSNAPDFNVFDYNSFDFDEFNKSLLSEKAKNAEIKKIEISQKYLENLTIKEGVTYIKSPKGSGKTRLLEGLTNDKSRSCLMIGNRVSLVEHVALRLDIDSYKDKDFSIERLGVCLDSLWRVTSSKAYYYLIIDEVEQVLSHFMSSTMNGKQNSVFHLLKNLISRAKFVIVLDADLSPLTINFIERCKNEAAQSTLVTNSYVSNDKSVNIYQSKNHIIEDIHLASKEGKKLFITSNSRSEIDNLYAYLNKECPRRCIKITGENSKVKSIKEFVSDFSKNALDYQIILTTPTIAAGIDISYPNHNQVFDHVFGIFVCGVTTHFDGDQQLSRVRHPKNVSVFISPQIESKTLDSKKIREDLKYNELLDNLITGYDGGNPILKECDILDLATDIVSIRHASMNKLKSNFINYKESQGFKIVSIRKDALAAEQGALKYKDGKSIYEKDYADKHMDAASLNFDKFEIAASILERGGTIEDDMLISYNRTKIERIYNVPLSYDIIKLDNEGKFRPKILSYQIFTNVDYDSTPDLEALKTQKDTSKRHKQSIFIGWALSFTGLIRNGELQEELVLTSNELGDFVKFMKDGEATFKRLFGKDLRKDIDDKPVSELKRLFGYIGLRFQNSGKKKVDGKTIYCYQLDLERLMIINRSTRGMIE
ncbi:MAG: hypothetical protein OCD03_09880 [Hyphomicrobiales bacterium]